MRRRQTPFLWNRETASSKMSVSGSDGCPSRLPMAYDQSMLVIDCWLCELSFCAAEWPTAKWTMVSVQQQSVDSLLTINSPSNWSVRLLGLLPFCLVCYTIDKFELWLFTLRWKAIEHHHQFHHEDKHFFSPLATGNHAACLCTRAMLVSKAGALPIDLHLNAS